MSRQPRGGTAGKPVTIRATDAERAAWVRAAGDENLSDWLRRIANRAATRSATIRDTRPPSGRECHGKRRVTERGPNHA